MSDQSILIFTLKNSSRSRYVFRAIFKFIMGLEPQFTSDKYLFNRHKGLKFSYGKRPLGNELYFYAADILFEGGIKWQDLKFIDYNGLPAFFISPRSDSAMPFDVFSATFFLISRYEEYYPHLKDEHKRFKASQSVAFQQGFLNEPIVNIWTQHITSILKSNYPEYKPKTNVFKFIPTIDIDNAFSYKEKGFVRVISGLLFDFFNLKSGRFKERFNVLLHRQKDPYDTYDYQIELIEKYSIHIIFFVLLGDYGPYDKNVPFQNKALRSLIKFLDDYGDVGIHPSYASNSKPSMFKTEVGRLQHILNREIFYSRQHYLKLTLPQTYERLIEADITDDFTMGYAEVPGFRAGICTPFFFYDLDLEIETGLKIHPFAIMDGTLKDYMKLEPEQCAAVYLPLIESVKKVNGHFITIWHNESFAENERWKGWRSVFEDIIEKSVSVK